MRSRIALASLLVLAACSGDDGAPASPPPTVATTIPEATTSAVADTTAPNSAAPAPSSTTTTSTAVPTTTMPLVPLDDLTLDVVEVADVEQAVLAVPAPGDDRLFVVDQPGRLWAVGDGDPQVFLDIRDDVTFGGERGLLGLAFHPGYADNGRFYVYYIGARSDSVVAEFTAEPGGVADVSSRRVILEIDQPAGNHNGGMVAFGPDGYLWISVGDGGGANDQYDNGQRPGSVLGTMLRIDVDADPYAIPADNPFPDGQEGAAEVWAYGLRNPWRVAFDGDRLYIADVGQNAVEEVDVISVSGVTGAPNFGWPIMEGSTCFRSSGCDQDGLVLPVTEYTHDDGCSVTGGFVYRGRAIPELTGHYLYGDYCAGWVRGFLLDDAGTLTEERQWFPRGTFDGLTGFGVDADGEVYVTTASGRVFRIVRADGA